MPGLVFLGDKWQLPGLEPTRPWQSAFWHKKTLRFVQLFVQQRCPDEAFQRILTALRTSRPTKKSRLVEQICRGHKAWHGEEPNVEDIRKLLKKQPDTMIITCTKEKANLVNDLAIEALHPRKQPLVELPGDIEANPANYIGKKLKEGVKLQPSMVPIYKGSKLYLTKNVRKEEDYVNGMLCTVQQWNHAKQCLRVKTKTGKRIMVTMWTDRDHGYTAYFPIRLGYACNVHKVQGDEFDHVTIWLDVPRMPAAGYAALSRVKKAGNYLIGGIMTRHHFVPAF